VVPATGQNAPVHYRRKVYQAVPSKSRVLTRSPSLLGTSSDAPVMISQMDIPPKYRLRPVLRPTPSGLMAVSSLPSQKAPGHTKTRRRTINTSPSTRRTRRKHKRRLKQPTTSFVIRTFPVNKGLEGSSRHKDHNRRHLRARRTRAQRRERQPHTRRNRRHRHLHHRQLSIRMRRSRARMPS
jgi:hypothetical protein